MYTRFESLLTQKKVKAADVCRATGIRSGTLTDWKKGRYTPKQDKLQKIAEYFNVTVDYLMNGNEREHTNIDNDIQALISKLTGDNSIYFSGKEMTEEGKLALLNSLKQDLQFLNALHSKDE